MENDKKIYWDRIKHLLKMQGKTQNNLCEYCGIIPQTFKNRMSMCGSSSVFEAVKIATYLNVSVEYLVTGKDTKYHDTVKKIEIALEDAKHQLSLL